MRLKWSLVLPPTLLLTMARAEQPKPLSVTVEQAVSIALRDNPLIRASRAETDVATYGVKVAASRPNPTLAISPFRSSEHADAEVEVSQVFEISGRRRLRTRVAQHGLASTASRAGELALEVAYATRLACVDVLAAEETARIARENVDLAARLADTTQKQFDAGDVPETDVIRARVELSKARQELTRDETAVASAKAELNRMLGREPTAMLEVVDDLAQAAGPEPDVPWEAVPSARPVLKAAEADILQAQAHIELERSARRPDLVAGVWRNEDKANALAIGLEFPLLDRGSIRNAVRQAQAELRAREAARDAVAQQIATEIERARIEVEKTRRLMEQYRANVLQPAERLMNMSEIGYREGLNRSLDVLEAQRTVSAAREEHVSLIAEHQRAIAGLRRALGSSPEVELNDPVANGEGDAQ